MRYITRLRNSIRGTKITTLNQTAVRKDSRFHIHCDLCFPLLYPLQQNGSPRLAVLQGTFGKKCDFCRKGKRLIRGTKITTLNQTAVRKDSRFHIHCDLCFPLLYPLQQNGSPRLAVLQGTFGKKCDFCRKGKRLIRGTKITTLNQSKNCFSYALEFCFPLRYPFLTKSGFLCKGIEFKGLFLNGKNNIDKKSYINRFSF